MPSELRFVLILTGLAAVAGAASVFGIYYQDVAQIRTQAEAMTTGHVGAGKAAIARYSCGACHRIPGIAGATGETGPALNGFALHAQIAGVLNNNPVNLARWLQHPQQVLPGNGMPEQGVTVTESHDMAAYLYTVKR
jgi:cytochrome c